MPDHLQDPCIGCEWRSSRSGVQCAGPEETENMQAACGPYAAYQAQLSLLERLKGEGVRVRDDKLKTWGAAGAEMANKHTGPGYLVWIPEGE